MPRRVMSLFAVDPRSLALFRIALGLLLAFEALSLLPEASALLSDRGVLPRCSLQPSLPTDSEFWSLNSASGGARWQLVLLLLQFCAGACLAFGRRPRVAALCGWALFSSAINRNPLMAHGGDALLRQELFFAAFVPLGARWAVDAPGGAADDDRPRASLGTAALLLQPVLMYVCAGALKFAPEWRSQYTAVYFALHVDMAVKWPALLLRRWPALCELASALTPPLEAWIGPVLLLFPVSRLRGRARLVGIALLSSLQLGFATCMVLGNFPYASTVAILPFVPLELWAVLLPRDADAEAAWQRRARLWARALRRAAAALLPAPEASATPPTPAAPLGRGSRALLLAICAWIALWNLQSYCAALARFGGGSWPLCWAPLGVPRSWLWFGELLSLHQSWDLFAPAPNREDGWFVLPAQMVTGELRDVATGGPLDFARPPLPSAWYVAAAATPATASRWLQYHLRIWEEARKPERQQNTQLFSALVQWHCRRHRPPLARLALVFVRERTPPPTEEAPPPEHLQIWQEDCLGWFPEQAELLRARAANATAAA